MPGDVLQFTLLRMGNRKPSTPKEYRDAIMSRLRKAREAAGLEEADVAASLGVKLDTYRRWELRAIVPHHMIVPVCEIVGIDAYELLTGHPFMIRSRSQGPPRKQMGT